MQSSITLIYNEALKQTSGGMKNSLTWIFAENLQMKLFKNQ